jgi:hypothetical protein
MKIKILKEGLKNGDNMDVLKVGDVITVSKERAEKAIELGRAEEAKTRKNKSQQDKISDNLEKK